ncbi:tRNA (adenosine(37)-N6)-threonylcarbamoyltransferase complex transferase subunit TsaD [soil metagenome]
MATILGIESTCDETGAAVVIDGSFVRSNVVASQVSLHEKYRGVVPEIASRAHIENILPVIREALALAACRFDDIDAIAVAHRPGLIGSLLIGVTAAKTLAWSIGKPLIGVDHVHAHLYSVMLDESPHIDLPAVGLVISGGHTSLYRVNSWTDVALLGSTIDDAVGEAYDKVAAILGLSYPGGPIVDELAAKGDPKAIRFPRSLLGRESLDFSFSGLKTAVLYHVRGVPKRYESRDASSPTAPPPTGQELFDICASFQAACIDTILRKLHRAAEQIAARSIVIGGGVSANRGLRNALSDFDLPVFFPPMQYCTDNAAMTAGLANLLLDAGQRSGLDLDAVTYSQFRP